MDAHRLVKVKMTAAALAVIAASILPWGMVELEPSFDQRAGHAMTNGWTGALSFYGVTIPHLALIFIAVGLAAWSWFNPLLGRKNASAILALYGVVHSLLSARIPVLKDAGGGGIQLGPIVALFAFVVMLTSMNGVPDLPAMEAAEQPS